MVGDRFTFCFFVCSKILSEKTIWTWSRGPQMVGFALWHIHPGFEFVGVLFSFAVALWLVITVPYAIVRRPRDRTLGLADDGGFGRNHCGVSNS